MHLCPCRGQRRASVSSPFSLCSSSEGLSLNLELVNLRDPSVSVPSVLGSQVFVGPFPAFCGCWDPNCGSLTAELSLCPKFLLL